MKAHLAYMMIWFQALFLLLASCSLEDGRDACYWKDTVRFRYEHEGRDCFTEFIHDTRWFLFDKEGAFMTEMEHLSCCPKRVDISSLGADTYTLICIGNLSDYASLEGYLDEGLDAFRLRVDNFSKKGKLFANGDRIYWGECRFTVVPGNSNRFFGEMSNVHCVLRVRAEWELTPEFPEGYRFSLDGIGTGMELHGFRADSIGVHAFPPVGDFSGGMTEKVMLRRFALETELITLRWDKEHIPFLQLWHDDEPVTKAINLREIFLQWGWIPERSPAQEYAIHLLIRADGSVIVHQGIETDVGDWENGGMIG